MGPKNEPRHFKTYIEARGVASTRVKPLEQRKAGDEVIFLFWIFL